MELYSDSDGLIFIKRRKRKTQAGVRIRCINQKTNYSEDTKVLCLSYLDA
jgi:CobQ-like glutamine amidotransferase family enzyme